MATKQDIEDLLKSNYSRKSFQPSKFSRKASENAREFFLHLTIIANLIISVVMRSYSVLRCVFLVQQSAG